MQGLQAVWLKRLLCGEFSLPPRGKMERAVEIEQVSSRVLGVARGTFLHALTTHLLPTYL